MAKDPALDEAVLPKGVIAPTDLVLEPDALCVFDFDGVVINRSEDDLYKLPASEAEEVNLRRIEKQMGLHVEPMHQCYRRHLIYQIAATQLGMPMVKGPAFDLYRTVAQQGRAFLLTARSGFYACQRAMAFLADHNCPPIENFFVGRGGKNVALKFVCEEYAPRSVYFVEDSIAHLSRAARMKLPNLRLVHVTAPNPPRPQADLAAHLQQTLARAFP